MTPDSWDRRVSPVNEGYWNPLDRVTFSMAYDSGDDEVTITASRAFFNAVSVESIVVDMDDGPTTINLGAGYTITSPTTLVITNAAALGATVDQVDFYGEPAAAGILRGTALGPLELSAPAPAGAVYDSGADELVITDPLGSFVGITTEPYVALWAASFPLEVYEPDLVVDSNTQITLQNFTSYANFHLFIEHVTVFNDGNANYPGTPIFDVDVAITDFEDATKASIRQLSSPSAGRLQLDGVRFVTASGGALDKLVVQSPGPIVTYYDPSGPNAGLNPGGATFPVWTDTQIVIDDAANLTGVDLGYPGDDHSLAQLGYVRPFLVDGFTQIQNRSPHPNFTIT